MTRYYLGRKVYSRLQRDRTKRMERILDLLQDRAGLGQELILRACVVRNRRRSRDIIDERYEMKQDCLKV